MYGGVLLNALVVRWALLDNFSMRYLANTYIKTFSLLCVYQTGTRTYMIYHYHNVKFIVSMKTALVSSEWIANVWRMHLSSFFYYRICTIYNILNKLHEPCLLSLTFYMRISNCSLGSSSLIILISFSWVLIGVFWIFKTLTWIIICVKLITHFLGYGSE